MIILWDDYLNDMIIGKRKVNQNSNLGELLKDFYDYLDKHNLIIKQSKDKD